MLDFWSVFQIGKLRKFYFADTEQIRSGQKSARLDWLIIIWMTCTPSPKKQKQKKISQFITHLVFYYWIFLFLSRRQYMRRFLATKYRGLHNQRWTSDNEWHGCLYSSSWQSVHLYHTIYLNSVISTMILLWNMSRRTPTQWKTTLIYWLSTRK